ncbi:Hypothetical predicted protein [Paramuricea clavata]|uniref:Uncharacterized protein n=1 Tax=Paramuricea clavata TaxID=317549 RepID=A0A6S7JCT0_PARCT|nr:Hypothetical predicted protein [Paramuricea clavata]
MPGAEKPLLVAPRLKQDDMETSMSSSRDCRCITFHAKHTENGKCGATETQPSSMESGDQCSIGESGQPDFSVETFEQTLTAEVGELERPSTLSEVEEPSMEQSSTDTESEAGEDAVGTRCVWAILFRFDSETDSETMKYFAKHVKKLLATVTEIVKKQEEDRQNNNLNDAETKAKIQTLVEHNDKMAAEIESLKGELTKVNQKKISKEEEKSATTENSIINQNRFQYLSFEDITNNIPNLEEYEIEQTSNSVN